MSGTGTDVGKQQARAALLAARRARGGSELATARAAVRDVVLHRVAAAGWECVAAYEPLRTEPGSVELLAGLCAAAVRVLVPITLPDRDLDWAEWEPGAGLSAAPREVVRPALGPAAVGDADAVLVPALAVAGDGTRLGRGGGSYDRALRRVRPGAVVAALLFDGELVPELPRDDWDVPVGAVATPSGWFAVGGD